MSLNIFRKGKHHMTTHTDTAAAPLPEGFDDRKSFWYVPLDRRADYVSLSSADLAHRERKNLRERLASILYDDAAEVWRAETLANYMARYNVTERDAMKYLGGFHGRIVVDDGTSLELHQRFDVGGIEWPADAEARVEHLWRSGEAARRSVSRAKAAEHAAANKCPMCEEVAPDHPDRRVARRTPVRGLPPVHVCRNCADTIADLHADRVANAVVHSGKSRRDLASEFLDAHEPNAARPAIRTGADLLAAAGRTGGR